jgi:hypothetical protein
MAGTNQSEFIVRLLDQISGPAAKAAAAFKQIGAAAKAQQTTFESNNAFAIRLSNSWLAAATAATAAAVAIGETVKTSVEAYGKLEEAMTSVQFQSGRTKQQMDDLQAGFKKLSTSMYYGVSDIANASLLIGEAFKNNTSGLNAFMQSAENLARATGGSLPDAVKTMAIVMRRLDIPEDQKDRVADFFTVLKGATGAPMEEISAGVGHLANALSEAHMPGLEPLKRTMALVQATAIETGDLNEAFTDVQKLVEVTSRDAAQSVFGPEVGKGSPEQRLTALLKQLDKIKDFQEQDYELEQAGFGSKKSAMFNQLRHAQGRLPDADAEYGDKNKGIAKIRAEEKKEEVSGYQDRMAAAYKNLTASKAVTSIWKTVLQSAAEDLDSITNFSTNLGKTRGFLPSLFGGGTPAPDIQKHAQGGLFTTPHIGMVAESGPELIIPLSGLGGGTSATEQSARGQKSLLNPLESIDYKMSKLVEFWTRSSLFGGGSDDGTGSGGFGAERRSKFGHGGLASGKGNELGADGGGSPDETGAQQTGAPGQYRKVYNLGSADLSDAVVNTVAGEARLARIMQRFDGYGALGAALV